MKFRKKPVEVEAVRFEAGDTLSVLQFIGNDTQAAWAMGHAIEISTLEGVMRADPGDWIIKGVKGEFYPCKPDIFEATYEAITTGELDDRRHQAD